MNIEVFVRTSFKENRVEYTDNIYKVYTKESPHKNHANIAVIDLLSEYLNIPKNRFLIKKGFKSKRKLIEIID